jgi:uncharacterized protein YyaL (SSP411 family)
MSSEHKMPNRLMQETSPYLKQHAFQPVDWHPWGEEAFQRAKQENKPVFLSIGYSSCHWCHVMAHESFEDSNVAELLNRDFISVKVDREERPEIDAVYMQACQAMTGSGGWPLTVFLTPEKQPFFAGTYFPKNAGYGQVGFIDLITTIARKWHEAPAALRENGLQVVKAFEQAPSPSPGRMTRELFKKAKIDLDARFDDQYGGFGGAPKFPSPHVLMFLLRYAYLEQDARALFMAEKTLLQMYKGGIYDHLGGGFSRYSTERKWLIPHFEKMLYDNALLAMAYTEAYQIKGKALYRQVAADTLDYVLREMTGAGGGFFSAQDADSRGEEGAYYTFTPEEILQVLGKEDGQRFCAQYGVTKEGVQEGKSILNRLEVTQEEDEHFRPLRDKLLAYRRKTRSLFTDDKILAAWNGLMIVALCKAAVPLNRPDYLQAARRAMDFAEKNLTANDGSLYVSWREGRAMGRGGLSDYAAMAWAYLALYEAELNGAHVKKAEALCRLMVRNFFDEKQGDFFLSCAQEDLIFRPKEHYDGAMPSGNAMAAYVLFRLAHLTGEDAWMEYATRTVERLAGVAKDQPTGYCFALIAGMERCYLPMEITCAALGENNIADFAAAMGKRFLPHAIVTASHLNAKDMDVPGVSRELDVKGHIAAYYLCTEGACRPAMFSLMELEAAVDGCLRVPQ